MRAETMSANASVKRLGKLSRSSPSSGGAARIRATVAGSNTGDRFDPADYAIGEPRHPAPQSGQIDGVSAPTRGRTRCAVVEAFEQAGAGRLILVSVTDGDANAISPSL